MAYFRPRKFKQLQKETLKLWKKYPMSPYQREYFQYFQEWILKHYANYLIKSQEYFPG